MCVRLCGKDEAAKQPNKNDSYIQAELGRWIKETTALGPEGDAAIMALGHRLNSMVHKCRSVGVEDRTVCKGIEIEKTKIILYGYTCFSK